MINSTRVAQEMYPFKTLCTLENQNSLFIYKSIFQQGGFLPADFATKMSHTFLSRRLDAKDSCLTYWGRIQLPLSKMVYILLATATMSVLSRTSKT